MNTKRNYKFASLSHAYAAFDESQRQNAQLIAMLKLVTSYLADLNGCEWIEGYDPGAVDMRQRAKALQSASFQLLAKIKGE